MSRAIPPTERLSADDDTMHDYETILFNPEDGFDLLSDVLEIAGEPLGSILGAMKGEEGAGLGAGGSGLSSLLDGQLDGEALGRGIASFARAIQAKGGSKLVRRVLRNTLRDGKPLSSQPVFDEAFQGNYGELGRAIVWVLKANFGKALKILGNPTSPAIAATRG